MKTELITTALSRMKHGEKAQLARDLNIRHSNLLEKAKSGHKLAYIGDKILTMSKAEEAALVKFGFIG